MMMKELRVLVLLLHCLTLVSSLRMSPAHGALSKQEPTIVTVTTKSWGYENYWTIKDSSGAIKCRGGCVPDHTSGRDHQPCTSESAPMAYQSHKTTTHSCPLASGTSYTLSCECDYGDGWHGGFLTIDGNKYCDDFTNSAGQMPGMVMRKTITLGGDMKITGDPHVVNMAGTKFDIKQLGTFSLLTASEKSEKLLVVDAFIDRIKLPNAPVDLCAPTYMQSLSFKGKWIKESGKAHETVEIGVRANHWESRNKALEVGFNGQWQKAEKFFNYSYIEVKEGQWAKVNMNIHGLMITVELLTVNPNDPVVGKYGGFNALNLKVHGAHNLAHPETIKWNGLLAYDDFTEASAGHEKCKNGWFNSGETFSATEIPNMLSDLHID